MPQGRQQQQQPPIQGMQQQQQPQEQGRQSRRRGTKRLAHLPLMLQYLLRSI